MTAPAPRRTVLPLLRAHEGGRSAMTCHFRCDDACSKPVPNPTDNSYFGDLVAAGASRRSVLKGGGLVAAVVGLTTVAGTQPAAAAPAAAPAGPARPKTTSPFGFTPIAPQPEGTRQGRRPGRFRLVDDRLVGRPDPRRRARLRLRAAERRGPGGAVRLQQRLRRPDPHARQQPRGAGGQQRVHQRRADVPRLHRQRLPHPRADPHHHGRPRHVRRRGPPQRRLPAVEACPGRSPEPPHHRHHALRRGRPGCRPPAAEDQRRPHRPPRSGHRRQLRGRHHPLGHRPVRGGELPGLLQRHRRPCRPGRRLPPLRHHGLGPRLGAGRQPLRHRCGAQRGQPVRLRRRGRPVRPGQHPGQAHRAGPAQARGRQRHDRPRRPGGRLHRRRRALRLPLQVRLARPLPAGRLGRGQGQQPDAAVVRRPLRREVHR